MVFRASGQNIFNPLATHDQSVNSFSKSRMPSKSLVGADSTKILIFLKEEYNCNYDSQGESSVKYLMKIQLYWHGDSVPRKGIAWKFTLTNDSGLLFDKLGFK